MTTATRPNPNNHPAPRSTLPLIAPNKQSEIQRTIDEHPEIDTMDEEARGEILDITARRINPAGGEKPWGRKARNDNPTNPNLNTDGFCYLRLDGLFEIYDAISGIDGQSSWEGYGPYAPGENGYWWPPNPVEDSGGGDTGGGGDVDDRLTLLESQVADLATQMGELQAAYDTLDARVAAVEYTQTQPFRAHGPVDLPIVLESLTRLRCKGDIDVDVKPGQATPPAVSADTPPGAVDLVLLKRLFDRIRPDDEGPRKGGQ